jgi:hypothetical protein
MTYLLAGILLWSVVQFHAACAPAQPLIGREKLSALMRKCTHIDAR